MGLFERFLTVWAGLGMLAGVGLGLVIPGAFQLVLEHRAYPETAYRHAGTAAGFAGPTGHSARDQGYRHAMSDGEHPARRASLLSSNGNGNGRGTGTFFKVVKMANIDRCIAHARPSVCAEPQIGIAP